MFEIAKSEDFESIAQLNVLAYEEFAAHLQAGSWEIMQKNLSNIKERADSATFLLFRVKDELVGSVAYCPAGKSDSAVFRQDMASILLLAVHPRQRGKGLAKALTKACISMARRDGARSIGLFTSELMISAQHVYRSLGFQEDAELPMRHGIRYFRYILELETTNLLNE